MKEKIKSELQTKATASLEEQVKQELLLESPTIDKAKALLRENEITTGND